MNLKTLFSFKRIQTLFEYSLCVTAFTLPLLRPHWNSKIVLLSILLWIPTVNLKEWIFKIKENRIIWLFLTLFLLDIIGMLRTENIAYGVKYIETKLPIFFFPLILLAPSDHLITKRSIEKILISFLLGVLTVIGFYLFLILKTTTTSDLSISTLLHNRLSDLEDILHFRERIDLHPSYLSLYISLSSLFLLLNLIGSKFSSRPAKYFQIFLLLILTLFQVWLNSRAGLIGFTIGVTLLLILHQKTKGRILTLLTFTCLLILIVSFPVTKERFINAPLRSIRGGFGVNPTDQESWPITFRFQIADCSLELLKDYHWLTGYGTGDFRDKMAHCYETKNYGWLVVREFDQHCEYFAQWHRHGILGLLTFLLCLILPLILAVRKGNWLYVCFICLIIISAIPENILSAQKGVMFYALFNSLLFIGTAHVQEINETKPF